MINFPAQYSIRKEEIDKAVISVMASGQYINGPAVDEFSKELSEYMGGVYVVPCANGTDALQISLMALDLNKDDEIIIPAFNYAASVEVCLLLKLKPVFCDVGLDYNISPYSLIRNITEKTKVIIVSHLFGLPCDMTEIMDITTTCGITVIEDNAQSLGSSFMGHKCGVIGHIGTTSFFPTKNLGCFGDGGAIFCIEPGMIKKMSQIANHGQLKKYVHDRIGINSRLDSIQAAILSVKLKYLDEDIERRRRVASVYNQYFNIKTNDTHTYNQYTIRVNNRFEVIKGLKSEGFNSNVYYPIPLYKQNAYSQDIGLKTTEKLCNEVMSLPIDPFMDLKEAEKISKIVKKYESKNCQTD